MRLWIDDEEGLRGAIDGVDDGVALVGGRDAEAVVARVRGLARETADRRNGLRRRVDEIEVARASRRHEQHAQGRREAQIVEPDAAGAARHGHRSRARVDGQGGTGVRAAASGITGIVGLVVAGGRTQRAAAGAGDEQGGTDEERECEKGRPTHRGDSATARASMQSRSSAS